MLCFYFCRTSSASVGERAQV